MTIQSFATTVSLGVLGGVALLVAPAARADFSTGFETSSGYTADKTAIGVPDTTSPRGTEWTSQGNTMTDDMVVVSGENPAEGEAHLRLIDRDANVPLITRIDLADAVDFSQPFSIQFSFAIPEDSNGGNFAFTFGEKWFDTNAKNWVTVLVSTDGSTKNELWALIDNGAGDPVTVPLLKDITAFSAHGRYLTIKVDVDPHSMTYTVFRISGRNDSTDRIAAFEGKQVPWKGVLPGKPKSTFTISSSRTNIGILDVDNISITQLKQ